MDTIQHKRRGGGTVQGSTKSGGTANTEQCVIGVRHGEGYVEEEKRGGRCGVNWGPGEQTRGQ